jgi:hypothetical protein
LIVVAHHHVTLTSLAENQTHLKLGSVGILEFVDDGVIVSLVPAVAGIPVAPEMLDGKEQHVVEGEETGLEHLVVIGGIRLDIPLIEVRSRIGVHELVPAMRDVVLDACDIHPLPVHALPAHDFFQDESPLFLLIHLELLPLRIVPDDFQSQRMESADPDTLAASLGSNRTTQELDPFLHLFGCFDTEGDCEDLLWVYPFLYHVGDPGTDAMRLARSGNGANARLSVPEIRNLFLIFVQGLTDDFFYYVTSA